MWLPGSSLLGSVFTIPIVSIVAGIAGWVVVTIAIQWRKAREAAYNARLKQLMIERGMSAAEIKSVLEADTSGFDATE